MQDVLRLLASRRSEILAVHFFDRRIFMGFPELLRRIVVIQRFRADRFHILEVAHICVYLGLSAAVDAAARTAHDPIKW